MTESHPRQPDAFVGYTIVRVAHVLQRRMEEALAPAGVNARQFSVLALLAQHPSVSAGQLARLVLVTPQSMSELLASLDDLGLVIREAPLGRGHPMGVTLSRAGKNVLRRAQPLVDALEARTTGDLSASEASRLNEQLHAILACLE